RHWVDVVFGELPPLGEDDRRVLEEAGAGFFAQAVAALERHPADFKGITADLRASTGRKGAELFMPLRIALTGRAHGPELASLLKLIPAATARRRLEAWTG